MKVPISWIKDYVDIDVNPKEFGDLMTMSGSKVEGVTNLNDNIKNIVVGKIVSLEKHPDADKLSVTKADIGSDVIQVVTGAQNINLGDFIPVALVGATLPDGKKISKGKLRGIESNGMMCSIQELNLSFEDYPEAPEHGIFILKEGLELGKDIKEVLGLNETVVEFEITSNRPDCLSVIGLSREAAVTLKKPFNKKDINVKEEDFDDVNKYAKINILDTEICRRYAARVVKNVKIGPSPKWLRDRLAGCGIRPINNIVDITNYVMLEYGQPMHAFDLKNIEEGQIVVRRANDGEKIMTLDGDERELDSSMLVIADSKKPVAVAGVMGGEFSGITDETTTILFECANFNGTSVRLTAKKLGMRTESSGRFEKGLDPQNVLPALNRSCELVELLGAGTVCKGIIDNYPVKLDEVIIDFRPEKINELLGTNIKREEMIEIFRNLEFVVDEQNDKIKIPSFRPDVEIEADLCEEVARFFGYNNIKPTVLEGKAPTFGKKTYKQKIRDIIKDTMVSCGLYEIYTYSFTSNKVFDNINLPKDSNLRNAIRISNPLGEHYSIMRTTTIPQMLEILSTNFNRRVEEARFFEMSKVYLKNESEDLLPVEDEILTVGMYGKTDFYDLKGIVEELFCVLGIKDYSFVLEGENHTFHPGRCANVYIGKTLAGTIGEIHPEVSKNYECSKDSYIGIFNIDRLVESANFSVKYVQLPKFPSVQRDIAMLVDDSVMVKNIEDIIKQRSGNIFECLELFDVYKGKQVPEGKKSVAYSIIFRAKDRTLKDEEVNKSMEKILHGLRENLKAELR